MSKKPKEICAENTGENRAPLSGEYLPIPHSKVNLANPESIRQEMARVYREARANKLDASDASKLIYMLSQIAKAYELGITSESTEETIEARMLRIAARER